jgi:hypothetical protein
VQSSSTLCRVYYEDITDEEFLKAIDLLSKNDTITELALLNIDTLPPTSYATFTQMMRSNRTISKLVISTKMKRPNYGIPDILEVNQTLESIVYRSRKPFAPEEVNIVTVDILRYSLTSGLQHC